MVDEYQQKCIYMFSNALESCAGRVDQRGLRAPAFAGLVRVKFAAGRARVERFFVGVTEC